MDLRALVIGAGGRGREWIREIGADDDWSVAAIVEVDAVAMREGTAASSIDTAATFREVEKALSSGIPFDAAFVVTPPGVHLEPTQRILAEGLPVLVEKPLSTSLSEAKEMVGKAEQIGVPLLVGMNHRYLRSHRTVKKVVESGRLGNVGLVASQYFRPPHDMAASLAEMTHQVMWGMGVHHLDALRFALGKEVVGVFARSFTLPSGDAPQGASLQAVLEFEGGTRGVYTATYESSGHGYFGGGQEYYQRLTGDRATLHVFHRWLFLAEGKRLPKPIRRGKREVTEERILLAQFRDAIVRGVAPECSGQDHLRTMAIVEACLISATKDVWVDPRTLL